MSTWTKTVGHTAAAVAGATISVIFVTAVFLVWHFFKVMKGF